MTQTTVVGDLLARIAELEKLAVVWHKYPDEKPDVGKTFLMYWTTAYGERTWMLEKRIDDGRHWMEKVKDVVWAYLPEPPEILLSETPKIDNTEPMSDTAALVRELPGQEGETK